MQAALACGMRQAWAAAFIYAAGAVSLCCEAPSLSAPSLVNGQLQFTLTCESNTAYRIDASTNLQTWVPVATNLEAGVTRTIRVPMIGERTVYRALARTPLFNFALLARETIDLNGNDIVVDSFDSGDPNLSTAGEYDPAKRSDRGDLASSSQLTSPTVVMDIGNARIYGSLFTGTNGRVDSGPMVKVGDLSWHSDHTRIGFQSAWRDELDLQFPQLIAPFRVAIPPASGLHDGTFYKYKLTSDNYSMAILKLKTNEHMVVTGNASLFVGSQLELSHQSSIVITPEASLRIYTDATNVVFAGALSNSNPAAGFILSGLSANVNIAISFQGPFVGCINAPDADIVVSNGGTSTLSIRGSIIARRVSMDGQVHIHYDEGLRHSGPFTW